MEIEQVRELSADEELRRLAFYREKRLHDEANAINGSRREGIRIGRAEGEKIGRAEGEKIGRAEGEKIGRAEGEKIGRAEKEKEFVKVMRLKGYSEEQINDILGAIN